MARHSEIHEDYPTPWAVGEENESFCRIHASNGLTFEIGHCIVSGCTRTNDHKNGLRVCVGPGDLARFIVAKLNVRQAHDNRCAFCGADTSFVCHSPDVCLRCGDQIQKMDKDTLWKTILQSAKQFNELKSERNLDATRSESS